MADKETYLASYSELEPTLASAAPEWLNVIRKSARDKFEDLGFPTTKNEQWRFTRVRPLLQHDFTLETAYQPNGLDADELAQLSFDDSDCYRMTFVNGNYAANLSAVDGLPAGVTFKNLKRALEEDAAQLEPHVAKLAKTSDSAFTALNTAYLLDGAYLHFAKDVALDKPVHLLFVTTSHGETRASYPRNLFIAEAGAAATIIESYVGSPGDVYFTNAVTEVVVADNARVDHVKVQKESRNAYHFANTQSTIGRDGQFHTNFISLGGALVRNDVGTQLNGENIESTLDGFYLADGTRHIDNHTHIDHAMPHCNSYELYKGILADRGKAVFNGKIHVHPDAQKTDAKQSNGCMLLSDDAQINTNPQLEIYADDVKCTHGAVIGQIEDEAVFYLRSRGFTRADARRALVFAFANEVIERIPHARLRDRLEGDVAEWLAQIAAS